MRFRDNKSIFFKFNTNHCPLQGGSEFPVLYTWECLAEFSANLANTLHDTVLSAVAQAYDDSQSKAYLHALSLHR